MIVTKMVNGRLELFKIEGLDPNDEADSAKIWARLEEILAKLDEADKSFIEDVLRYMMAVIKR